MINIYSKYLKKLKMLSSKFENRLKNIKLEESPRETIYTVFTNNFEVKKLIDIIYTKLEKIKILKNAKTKKEANDRLYQFKLYLDELVSKKGLTHVSAIFIIGNTVQGLNYSNEKELIKHFKRYGVNDIIWHFDYEVRMDIINDLFYSENLSDLLTIKKGKCIHKKFTRLKEAVFDSVDINSNNNIIEYIQNKGLSMPFIYSASFNKKDIEELAGKGIILDKSKGTDELIELKIKYESQKNIAKLEDFLANINNPSKKDLILTGQLEKQIKESIENYMVKELYLHDSLKSKFYSLIDKEYINFNIIWITKVDKDINADNFLKMWGGVIGELYFAV